MIISKVIRQYGFTIEQVAERIGIARGSLANMIGGNPTVETLQKIADAIGCKRSEFFADEAGEKSSLDVPTTVIRCSKCGNEIKVKFEQ